MNAVEFDFESVWATSLEVAKTLGTQAQVLGTKLVDLLRESVTELTPHARSLKASTMGLYFEVESTVGGMLASLLGLPEEQAQLGGQFLVAAWALAFLTLVTIGLFSILKVFLFSEPAQAQGTRMYTQALEELSARPRPQAQQPQVNQAAITLGEPVPLLRAEEVAELEGRGLQFLGPGSWQGQIQTSSESVPFTIRWSTTKRKYLVGCEDSRLRQHSSACWHFEEHGTLHYEGRPGLNELHAQFLVWATNAFRREERAQRRSA